MYKKRICIDFDGVIHAYTSPWTRPQDIHDPPVPGAIEWLRELLEEPNLTVALYTARMQGGRVLVRKALLAWFQKHGLTRQECSLIEVLVGKPHAVLYVDDRAYRFRGQFPSVAEITAHPQWNKGTPESSEELLAHDLRDALLAARRRGLAPYRVRDVLEALLAREKDFE